MKFNDRVKAARKYAGLKQAELAEKILLLYKRKVSQANISKLESEEDSEGSSYTPEIAGACGVSAIWLSSETGPMVTEARDNKESASDFEERYYGILKNSPLIRRAKNLAEEIASDLKVSPNKRDQVEELAALLTLLDEKASESVEKAKNTGDGYPNRQPSNRRNRGKN